MRHISAQLQTGLQAFLQQPMENMFNRLKQVLLLKQQTQNLTSCLPPLCLWLQLPQSLRNPWTEPHLNQRLSRRA